MTVYGHQGDKPTRRQPTGSPSSLILTTRVVSIKPVIFVKIYAVDNKITTKWCILQAERPDSTRVAQLKEVCRLVGLSPGLFVAHMTIHVPE